MGSFKAPANGDEPSKEFLLLQSMQEKGQLQACLGLETKKGIELIAGFRRHAAAKALKFKTLRVTVYAEKDKLSEKDVMLINLAENVAREDLSAPDLAKRIVAIKQDNKISFQDLANQIGMSKSATVNLSRIWTKIHPRILEAWRANEHRNIISQQWLLGIVSKSHEDQWNAFDRLAHPEKYLEPGTPGGEPDPTPGDKSTRGTPKNKLINLLGLLRDGHYKHQGADWVNGATVALEHAVNRVDFPAAGTDAPPAPPTS